MTDQLAEAGYIAIAPDLLSGKAPERRRHRSDLKSGGDVGQGDSIAAPPTRSPPIERVADYVANAGRNGKVVVGGFCWGGSQSFRYATNNKDIKDAFVFYGTPRRKPKLRGSIARSSAFTAGTTTASTSTIPKPQRADEEGGKTYEPVIYEGAGTASCAPVSSPIRMTPTKKRATKRGRDGKIG